MIHLKENNSVELEDTQDENIRIQYKDFPHNSALNTYLKGIVQGLRHESPSDSVLKVTFTKTGRVFKGMINIYSKAGRFFARAEDLNITAMSNKLLERIHSQLDKWKIQRFRIHKELKDPKIT